MKILKIYLPISGVLLHALDFFLWDEESLLEGIKHFLARWILLREIVRTKLLLHLVLNVERKSVFQQSAYLSTVLAVAIANREEVTVFQAHYVWRGYVRILVYFVRIMSSYTSFRCERELCNHITYFIALTLFVFTAWRSSLCGGVVLGLIVAIFFPRYIFSLFWVWFLILKSWRHLLNIGSHLLHLLDLLLHSYFLWVCLNSLKSLALSESTNIQSL